MRFIPIFLAVLCAINFSCRNQSGGPAQKPAEVKDLPGDFLSFYQKFHEDSLYQMSHIQWPLKGEKAEAQADQTFKKVLTSWEPGAWVLLHAPDLSDPGLKRSFETVGDVLIIEHLDYPMVNFGLERQFFKEENGEWNMIFYSEMQELH